MTKKLILITVAALTLLYSEASLAKVCRLGDTSCDTNGFYGSIGGECDASYKTCDNPRIGASYCYAEVSGSDKGVAKYKDEDCCSTLVANNGYQECSIDDALVGYGKSCKGAADNITYWEFCGCAYGFVEVDSSNNPDSRALLDENNEEIFNLDGNLVPYEARCAYDGTIYGGKCRFAECNTDRRFFFENAGEHCKYREETRCGGFGCMQVYDCNHDELNTGKEYYRNDSLELANGWENFIPYLSEDQMTNEKAADGTVQLIEALNSTGTGLLTGDYNLTNKIVCAYAQSDGTGNDTGTGLSCNDVPNFCYLWTGCNNVRKWYSNNVNEGVVYDSEEAYLKWMDIVENQDGYNYSAQYVKNNPYHDAFLADVNPGYGKYTPNGNSLDAVNNSSCIQGVGCRITSANNGCTYITTNCHQDDAQHQCWKKISCSEENRFYSSFINAYNIDDHTGKQELYLSSLNAPYWDEFYAGLLDKEIYPACLYEINECNDASGCYKKIGCEPTFEDIRDHLEIENDWYPWFSDIRAICNDATRCYKATSCEASVGAYSSRPNTSFFVTISSTATGLTCFRGQECYLATGSYTSVPNTSFFVTITSYASGSTCYRGQNCYIDGGAYSSSPNTQWFYVDSSTASGSTCYRGEGCKDLDAGAYSSEPNTSFFYTINSFASGSGCYRGSSCNIAAGAYSSTPNTSFFITIKSSATGSTAYRGEESHIAAGAYSSAPNTSFFTTIKSLASGSTSYRGESVAKPEIGAYTSTPNTSFFFVIKSLASGSTAYRGQESHIAAGAYSSAPNTSFFHTISSIASGSTSYRADSVNDPVVGVYSSTPNTSFFFVIKSLASGSTAYRGQESHIAAGAYSSTPNTSFFFVIKSLASGSTSYRGEESHIAAGAYSSAPNREYFIVIQSSASGSISYRGESANLNGAYTSRPNTSFFLYGGSLASGSTAYRGSGIHEAAGAYSSTPNTSFFITIKSLASGSTSYRGEKSHIAAGAYSSMPNTSFFYVIKSLASGSTSYRGEKSHIAAGAYSSHPNTSFFHYIQSLASGSTSYRADKVADAQIGAYTSTPNTSFFFVHKSLGSGSTAYRGAKSHLAAGAYSSHPNTSFFHYIQSLASGSTSYRAERANDPKVGVYTSTPNSTFFLVHKSLGSGSTAYRGAKCADTSSPTSNTSFFIHVYSLASGSKCYRTDNPGCNTSVGAYSVSPNTSFFMVHTSQNASKDSTCYRGFKCRSSAYTASPNTSFFNTIHSKATGSTCYRGESCRTNAGAYVSSPNTKFFDVVVSGASGSNCYRGQNCAWGQGAYASSPNTKFFYTVNSYASGSMCFRATACNKSGGSYASSPNTQYFYTVSSYASGSRCYRATSCATDRATATKSNIDSSIFYISDSSASGSRCYRATACNTGNYWSTSRNTTYFAYRDSDTKYNGEAGSTNVLRCYQASGCSTSACESSERDTTNFYYSYKSTAITNGGSTTTCYRATNCVHDTWCDPEYFSYSTTSSGCGSSGCVRGQSIDRSDVCHLTDAEQRSTSYKHAGYYTWGNPESCGSGPYSQTRDEITGCNMSKKSYNSSYGDKTVYDTDGASHRYDEVFEEHTNVDAGIACSGEGDGRAVCFISCSCNEENEWYSSCPGDSADECVSVTDERYAGGLASMSANGSLSSMSANGGLSAMSAGNSLTTASADNYTISTMSSGSATKCYQFADCKEEEGWFDPLENSTSWGYVQEFMNLEKKGRCYKALSCKSPYHNEDDLIPDYKDYYYTGMSVSFGGLTCIDGRCLGVVVDEHGNEDKEKSAYFTTEDKDLGDGVKCPYATSCKYPYSSSPDTSGCYTNTKVEAKSGVVCYDHPRYDGIIDVTAYTVQNETGAYGALSSFGIGASGSLGGWYSASMSIDGGDSWSGNNLTFGGKHMEVKTVTRIARATVTSFSINGMSCSPSSATQDCSLLDCTYNEGAPNGPYHSTYLVRFFQDVSEVRFCPSGQYYDEPPLTKKKKKYMEVKQDNSTLCYYVECKSGYSDSAADDEEPVAEYGDVSCYEP